MTQGMGRRRPRDAGRSNRVLDGALQDRFMQVMASTFALLSVDVEARCWKDPLPRPLAVGIGILGAKSTR